jgi:hypothetical protein
LETKLDPTLPANQHEIQVAEAGWRREQVMGRLHPWKLFGVGVVLMPIFLLTAAGLVNAIGLQERWTMPFLFVLFGAGYYTLIRVLEKGRLHWFLRT